MERYHWRHVVSKFRAFRKRDDLWPRYNKYCIQWKLRLSSCCHQIECHQRRGGDNCYRHESHSGCGVAIMGVSVDTSPTPAVNIDMAAAYEGGGNFMARLQQLSDAKSAADAALVELNLGKT